VGVRVEDDVLLTEAGTLVLSHAAVKEPDDIEAIVGKHNL
jgi:Xaa-Pro aminopeptidase